MTLVETMSPPVTPSADCVLNRNEGRHAGLHYQQGEVQGECPGEG